MAGGKKARKGGGAALGDMGSKFGRPDLDRIGLFSEAPYISTGESYDEKKNGIVLAYRSKGKQFLIGPPKRGHDTKDAYFDKDYIRLFENEPYTDLVVLRRRWRLQAKESNIVPAPFKPSSVPPKPSGKGSIFGTIEQQWPLPRNDADIPSFAAVREEPKKDVKINFLTRPPKHGTGYGYPNVTIGKPYEYVSAPYDAAEMALRREHAEHKQRLVGERPFVSSIATIDFFNSFSSLNSTKAPGKPKTPKTPSGKKGASKLPPVPFKPPSAIGFTINRYPAYEAPSGKGKSGGDEAGAAGGDEATTKAQRQTAAIFRPAGIPKSYPIKSIVEVNTPLVPPHWIQDALSAATAVASM